MEVSRFAGSVRNAAKEFTIGIDYSAHYCSAEFNNSSSGGGYFWFAGIELYVKLLNGRENKISRACFYLS